MHIDITGVTTFVPPDKFVLTSPHSVRSDWTLWIGCLESGSSMALYGAWIRLMLRR
jgi:hypothetical protein